MKIADLQALLAAAIAEAQSNPNYEEFPENFWAALVTGLTALRDAVDAAQNDGDVAAHLSAFYSAYDNGEFDFFATDTVKLAEGVYHALALRYDPAALGNWWGIADPTELPELGLDAVTLNRLQEANA